MISQALHRSGVTAKWSGMTSCERGAAVMLGYWNWAR
jgi:hypothetical protein